MTPELWTRCPKATPDWIDGQKDYEHWSCRCHGRRDTKGLMRVPFDEAELEQRIAREILNDMEAWPAYPARHWPLADTPRLAARAAMRVLRAALGGGI